MVLPHPVLVMPHSLKAHLSKSISLSLLLFAVIHFAIALKQKKPVRSIAGRPKMRLRQRRVQAPLVLVDPQVVEVAEVVAVVEVAGHKVVLQKHNQVVKRNGCALLGVCALSQARSGGHVLTRNLVERQS
jgi:hypothetical protein